MFHPQEQSPHLGSMEPGVPKQDVVGENEALHQFFSGEDVSGVLDSSVSVDTSILEQYLSADMCPNNFILPESPPDSGSEAFSPAQMPECIYKHSLWSNPQMCESGHVSSSCRFKSNSVSSSELLTHEQLRTMGLTNINIKPGTPPAPPALKPHIHQSPRQMHSLPPRSSLQGYTPLTPPSPPLCSQYCTPFPEQEPCLSTSSCSQASTSISHSSSQESRKRKRSDCEDTLGPKAPYDVNISGNASTSSSITGSGSCSSLTWDQYNPGQWSTLLDSNYQPLSPLVYHVDADKGFTYSTADDVFVCQKKNHFQVTVHIGITGDPHYVMTTSGSQEVNHFEIKVFGVKLEDPSHHVLIEQSQPDRSKKPFHPVRVSLPSRKMTKVTLGRLHFSETTANNIRKKGKPNPDQRYFQMVVGLYAAVKEEILLLAALVSEKIIVRASNPGQFETEGDSMWQRGVVQDSVVCHGRVGINTDSPDEALVVCGNAKVMGTILQPSDQRAKHNVQEVNSEQQLKRITQMRIVEFDYKPEFAATMGIDQPHQTGVIAQEVKELLPSAVREVGDVTCSDGEKIDNFLMVDKEQIFIENIGAVQQLSKLTNNLETRIQDLEIWNQRLAKLKSLTGSLRSHRKNSSVSTTPTNVPSETQKTKKNGKSHKYNHCLQHRVFQASVFTLLATLAFCMISITALYLVTLEEDTDTTHGHSNSSLIPPTSTAWTSTAQPTSSPGSWPPEVDFCDILYCDQVYCCPSHQGGSAGFTITLHDGWEEKHNQTKMRIQYFYNQLKSARDWTNTTIQHFMIKENQQIIDSKYCLRDECGPSRFVYRVPISQFVPGNMRITLLMNSTELLVVHLCYFDESAPCTSRLDINTVTGSQYPSNTQGVHEWPLHVARLYHSSYHFRSSVAGQANCSTDHHYAGVLFTDYHFHFYRRCTD
ncbi:myelin regulatory factor-like protein isoform X1 [Periophthalmus magnuspinnatus]|uniref:myelin regulatory factor-like protein isoform X1 n=2 Tax=Periophthalmus magnuspinnatus TaxID=409849 RepID=UPI00145A15A2|nr:myelin regulatory factor-like protein isoform X1 [Periophthalmus magnuspinnatus]XP_055087554.1 myelin regulatory factor-like protein isoform X1 [Periophthalmus magnuspinnatus]